MFLLDFLKDVHDFFLSIYIPLLQPTVLIFVAPRHSFHNGSIANLLKYYLL